MDRAKFFVCALLAACGGGPGFGDDTMSADGGSTPPQNKPDSGTQTGQDAEAPDAGGPTQIGNYAPKDMPDFKTPDELCAYVNKNRQDYQPHDRFKGPPWSGSYHTNTTWPLTFTMDSALMAEATMKAQALAGGQQPQGNPYSDGEPPPHEYLWITGVDTAHYVIASQEKPGDWSPEMFTGNIKAGITPTNGTSRMAMFYHDPGGSGPVLSKIGCGGAQSPGGSSWWWVVILGQ
jgi:hypothetical protein